MGARLEEMRAGHEDDYPRIASFPLLSRAVQFTEEDRVLVEKVAKAVVARRLEAPAIFLLESVRPVQFMASQAMLFFAPIVQIAAPIADWARVQRLLEERAGCDVLLAAIERYSNESPGQDGSAASSAGDK